ncbi:hypothetical protein BDN72DRAFT_583101 [Pluteus cervinus]|uniref:Uncharacterized protein n=1 Tax=Pluteus cervinus TaxID=181527 RepID=A0ACD3AVT0_9AGAR|nr:hypothetical protein BDN72DRAFT_583101 [Pluteus cervinus]
MRDAAKDSAKTKPEDLMLCLSSKTGDVQYDDAMHANAIISHFNAVSHAGNTSFQALRVQTQLLFEPAWLEWTLSVINTTSLPELSIDATTFSPDNWSGIFPEIHVQHLETFSSTGGKLHLVYVALFLQCHASTLRKLKLDIPIPPLADPVASAGVWPPSLTLDFDFPLMQELCLTPRCTPWFLNRVLSSGYRMENGPPPLPLLSLDNNLEVSAKLAKRATIRPVGDTKSLPGGAFQYTWFTD